MTDDATGKQYTVLETSTLNFDENTQTCASYNAILPEPRTEEENDFLNSLDAQLFPLGLTDMAEEGVWRWESDGSLVTWFLWAAFLPYGSNVQLSDPNGGRDENCVVMVKHYAHTLRLTSTASWADIACRGKQISPKNLVCQKKEGMCIYENKKFSI